jgi:hypothetical protein
MFEALTAVSAMMVAQTMPLTMSRLSTAQPAKPGYFESPAGAPEPSRSHCKIYSAPVASSDRLDLGLLVQNHVQQRFMDLEFPVVFDEAQFAEFVHEEADARSGSTETLPHQGGLGRLLEFYTSTEGAKAMPERRDERIVETETEARAGVTGHNVRYVLALGLGGVIVAFTIIYFVFFG